MNHHDAEISDVVVVLDNKGQSCFEDAVARLKELGLEVVETRPEEGVVEGNIDAARVHDLKSVSGVSYVRSVFTYVADYPAGDPRDKDGPEELPETDH